MTSLHPASHLHQCSSCCTLFPPSISIPSLPPVSRMSPSGHACPVGSPCPGVCIMWLDERVGCSHTSPPLHTHTHHPCLPTSYLLGATSLYQLVHACRAVLSDSGNVQHPGGELILTDYIPHGPHLLKTTFFSLSYARRPSRCCLTMRDRCFFTHSLPAKGTLPTHIEPAPLHAPRVIASCPVYLAPTPPNAHHRCPVASRVLFPSNR